MPSLLAEPARDPVGQRAFGTAAEGMRLAYAAARIWSALRTVSRRERQCVVERCVPLPGDGIAVTGYFGLHAERLAAYGYDVIPISLPTDGGNSPGKRPAQRQGCQNGCPSEHWPAFARYGLGILTRNTPALDIDVKDPWLAERTIAETQAPVGAPSARRLPDLPDPVQYDRAGTIRIARELLDHIERGTPDRPRSSAYLHDVAEVACIEEHLLATGGPATVSVEGEA